MRLVLNFRRDRGPARTPVPLDTTAVVNAVVFEGGPADDMPLTGYPALLCMQDGRVQVRMGTAPDAHLIFETSDPRYCALMAAVWMDACDRLNPVPAALSGDRP